MSEPPASHVVCLADDDSSTRKSLTRLLESDDFQVHAFSEPEVFLEYLTLHAVAVAILDICESTTGTELLAQLCARSPQTRVIFITAAGHHGAPANLLPAGAFALFTKPLDDEQFLSAVRRAFHRAHVGREPVVPVETR
jgi:FixJ family two-component response regulator